MKLNFIVVNMLLISLLTINGAFAQKKVLVKKDKFPGYAYSKETGKTKPGNLFKIKDGHILMDAAHPGYCVTKESYDNFILTAQFRWVVREGQKPKRNSGLMYYVSEDQKDELWPSGYQFQIKTNATGDFILLKNTTLKVNDVLKGPGASVVVKHKANVEKDPGEWNKIEIIANRGCINQYLNGQLVNEGKDASVSQGRILFQYEGTPIEFKDIYIEKFE